MRCFGLLDAVELDQHGALVQSELVDFGGQTARQEAPATRSDGGACQFGVGRQFVGILDGTIRADRLLP